ncbi:SDR family NAD(P)-dependent oxidoreductase [Paracoccus denitrificans]|jgi:3-oxoacyl-[acyl-carrier protein] reductase|uniref:Short-chain dehydrogenase/reductase SDR n=1 Tax=Paracoccus denitrificans (strain Pd 1222) TaxID=318586 RepID=A1B7W7_PARDP|nr:SDR family NAD(P)-dependent oxidoreductase [Paracoccus denitrificans]ABL71611.1 short-chain dehydrogenase/reductase SDR [Paracoccus denitrificans PD1222]MBB4628777.1 3-oxoacyl-[acyl-carrier protein] reductase [Paracoccus denitrificans]MCU7429915.1 SDR family oxidoreductase [Paracoccus denitrificans]QAR28206.1 SDR family oxidoreductase [Paracoccus denitrificans]UPV97939.1 SDR family oxidoreductase [Paracoccus denitrificans]
MTSQPLTTAIVTGAGSGIGRAIAHRLADEGHAVVVADRAAEGAQETVRQLVAMGRSARAAVLDITDPAATQALIDGAENLRVLVNNAGIFNTCAFDALTADDFRGMYEVNLVAMFTLCQQAARVLPEGGRIVNLASRAAFGARNYAHYVASKAAVAGLTKALALELAGRQITVNAVAPGVIATDMLLERSEGLEGLRVQQPTGKLGTPEHIAHAVAFFADPRAEYVTGQVLIVDGGRSVGGTAAF